MESLTRNNYEIWFLDYLDGQLSDEQLGILLDFLEQNPDLKAELLGVSGICLASGNEVLEQKHVLIKTKDDVPGITAIDQLCIARMENDLTELEAKRFDQRINEDAELSANYAAFTHTRLNPAKSVTYPFKKDLRKKTIIFSPWLITAISSAAVLMLVWFLWPNSPDSIPPTMAQVNQPTPDTPSLIPETRNPIPETQHPIPETRNLIPETRNPIPILAASKKVQTPENNARESVSMKSLAHKTILSGPRIPDPQSPKILFASNFPDINISPTAREDVLTIPQYALQLFREKILGQDRKLVKETRFSLWEVAGAGVNGINSLAGTDMKLNRAYDAQGDIVAVSFSSRLVDVESPVKAQ